MIDSDVASLSESKVKKDLQANVNSIQENLFYIAKIVEDLQEYARPLRPCLEKTNFGKIIEEVLLIVPIPNNLKVSIDAKKDYQITADCSMLKRIVNNLVQNAVQAMPNGGELTIGARSRDGQASIFVVDTGVGIPDDIKPKLFQPMVTSKAKGQGLGLAVVKRLVEAQGGTISFESEVGKGTKFIIELPVK